MNAVGLGVRRARARDAGQVAEFVNRAFNGQISIDRDAVIARLGDVGFLLVEENAALRGLLGWHVENLVVSVTDLIIWPPSDHQRVGQTLFREMERAAADLQAEAAVLFVPQDYPSEMSSFLESLGYVTRTVEELPNAWREVAYRAGRNEEEDIPVKELRPDRVFSPL